MSSRLSRLLCLLLATSTALAPCAVRAADDTAKTSVAAALGVTAASGKSTVSGGAGAIEAGLLSSDAMVQAGRVVASLTNNAANARRVLVVSRDQQVSLAMVRVIRDRIKAVRDLISRTPCPAPTPAPSPSAGGVRTQGITPKPVTPYLSDIAGAIAVDTTIAPIAFSVDDRLFADAILLGRTESRYSTTGGMWGRASRQTTPPPTGGARVALILPGEVSDVASVSEVRTAYDQMLREADRKRSCPGDGAKAMVQTTDALVTSLNAADKGALSPLVTAMQLEQLTAQDAEGRGPLLLRIAVEQTGGTAITRSGILYTLGLPGAAVVSAGTVVSFRLVEPTTGTTVLTGLVRCAVPQTRFQTVSSVVLKNADATACSYIAS